MILSKRRWSEDGGGGFGQVRERDGGVTESLPVGQGHALEELGERSINGQMAGAGLAKTIGLARLLVDRVEIIAFLGRVLAVRRGHHEVAAVDDLLPARRLLAARPGPGWQRGGTRVGPG